MARPKRMKVVIIQIKLWLIPGKDDDVIDYLRSRASGQRASAVVKAMRSGLFDQSFHPGDKDETNSILDSLGTTWN
jgi:hypothetical protein